MTPRKIVRLALIKQVMPVLNTAKESGYYAALVRVDFMDPEPMRKAYEAIDRQVFPDAAEREWRLMNAQVKGFGSFSLNWLGFLRDFIWQNTLDQLTTLINDTTKKNLRKVIEQAIENGKGIPDVTRQIEKTYPEMERITFKSIRVRATTIARTETIRARNAAKVRAAEEMPFEMVKVWRSAQDKRTRGALPKQKADHLHMDGQTVDLNQLFTDPRSGALMAYPGDVEHGAGAGDVINCRCSVNALVKKDANGKVIRKTPSSQPPAP
jgi:hypothetical protein